MGGVLARILQWLVGGAIGNLLLGAGLTLVSYVALSPLVNTLLSSVTSALSGVFADGLNILLLGGIGEVVSILGGALLTSVTINAGIAGLKKVVSP